MKKINLIAFAGMTVLFLASCTVAKIGGRGAVPILLNQSSESMQLIEHVKVAKTIAWDYTGSYEVSTVLADEIAKKKPDAVINTSIAIKVTPGNYFYTFFTCGLANAKTVEIEADFMKKK